MHDHAYPALVRSKSCFGMRWTVQRSSYHSLHAEMRAVQQSRLTGEQSHGVDTVKLLLVYQLLLNTETRSCGPADARARGVPSGGFVTQF